MYSEFLQHPQLSCEEEIFETKTKYITKIILLKLNSMEISALWEHQETTLDKATMIR